MTGAIDPVFDAKRRSGLHPVPVGARHGSCYHFKRWRWINVVALAALSAAGKPGLPFGVGPVVAGSRFDPGSLG